MNENIEKLPLEPQSRSNVVYQCCQLVYKKYYKVIQANHHEFNMFLTPSEPVHFPLRPTFYVT